MEILHAFHGICATLSLITGTLITLWPKGTLRHKKIGYVYVIAMLATVFSSLGIFKLFDGFGVYHVMSLISLISIVFGMYFPLFNRKNPNWVIHHYFWMVYSFIGLVMALGSHLMNSMPQSWPFWTKAVVAWILPYAIGTFFVQYFKNDIVSTFYKLLTSSNEPI